jgi:hypothetical protein
VNCLHSSSAIATSGLYNPTDSPTKALKEEGFVELVTCSKIMWPVAKKWHPRVVLESLQLASFLIQKKLGFHKGLRYTLT